MSRVQHLDYPDYLVFDLDPVEAPFSTVQKVAIVLKGVLDELGLRGYPKTSGASGIHVHLPVLEKTFTYEDVRVFAEAIASIVVQRVPEFATIGRAVRKRKRMRSMSTICKIFEARLSHRCIRLVRGRALRFRRR